MVYRSNFFSSLARVSLTGTVFLLLSSGFTLSAGYLSVSQETEATGASTSQAGKWKGKNGEILPFENDEEVIEFLRTAEVIEMEALAEGIGGAQRVVLEKDGTQLRAVFRTIEKSTETGPGLKGKIRRNFRDNYIFEVAAYELSRLLGLDSVPPTTIRQIHLEIGSLQLWVEKAMNETRRQREDLTPPNPLPFSRQYQDVKIFDNLIYNEDRNLGNILIDQDWRVWMIDHTRSFRVDLKLSEPAEIMSCRRDLWEKLRSLDDEAISARVDPYLTGAELDALLVRREALVEYIQNMIDQRGEQAVLYD